MIRGLAAIAGVAAIAVGQTTVSVGTPAPRLTSGEQVKLTATVRDGAGNVMSNASIAWRSSNAAILRVQTDGMVTGAGLGIADVFAQSGATQSSVRLQVLPSRIEVTPADVQMTVGDEVAFQARALDVNGQPIAGVNFVWSVVGPAGGGTNAAGMRNDGVLRATGYGRFTVRAAVTYAAGPGQFIPQFVGTARAVARARRDFRISRLVSTEETRSSFALRPRRGMMTANEPGQIALTASLDGLTNGLLLFRNGHFELLASGGAPTVVPSSTYYEFYDPSINADGEVLTRADSTGLGASLILGSPAGTRFVLVAGASAGDILNVTNPVTTRYSLNDYGDAVFRASFQKDGVTGTLTGLFRVNRDGRWSLDTDPTSPLPGLTGANLTLDQDFGIDNNGTVIFRAFDGTRRGVFRRPRFGEAARVLAMGDALNGSTVNGILQTAMSSTGRFAIAGSLANGQQFLLSYADGAAAPQFLAVSNYRAIYGVSNAGHVLFYADAGTGLGLHVWQEGNVTSAAVVGRPAPNGEPILEFSSGSVNSRGEVIAQARTADNLLVVFRATPRPEILYEAGARVEMSATVSPRFLVPGAKAGPPHILMGGSQGSVFAADDQGITPVMVLGDRLPDGGRFPGVYAVRKSPDGDLYVTTDQSAHRISSGAATLIARYAYRDPQDISYFASAPLSVNAAGKAVTVYNTNQSHQRLALADPTGIETIAMLGTNARYLTPSPAGGTFRSVSEAVLDDSGRTLALITVDNGPSGCFLFENGQWRAALVNGVTRAGGRPVASARALRTAGGRLYAVLVYQGLPTIDTIAEFDGTAWKPIVTRGELLPTGVEVTSLTTFEVNRRGDMVVRAAVSTSQALFLVTGNERRLIHQLNLGSEDGDLLVFYEDLDIRDDRRVYFTGMDNADRLSLYVAEPLF